MKLLGLDTVFREIFTRPRLRWDMTAKHHLPKPKPATPERKRRKQTVEASKRQNRRRK